MAEYIFKIQYGGVFIQLPFDLDSIVFTKGFLEYWIKRIKSKKEEVKE